MTLPFGLDRTFSVLSPRNINRRAARVATHFVYFAVLAVACWTATPLVAQTAHAGGVIPVGSGFGHPQSVAVDRSGNVFVADSSSGSVKEIVAVGGVVSASSTVNTINSGFAIPLGVAVDGAGNVFVADLTKHAISEIVAVGGVVSASSTVNTIGSGFNSPSGVAVDGAGNVFVADKNNNAVEEILAAGGYTTVNTIGNGFNLPTGVAVDGAGNVFVADQSNNAVKEILAAGGYTTVNTIGSGFNSPAGVAVDGAGDVFVADSGNGAVKEIVAIGGVVSSSSTVHTIGTGFNNPFGVAVDGSGNVFVGDTGNDAVKEIVLAAQKLPTTAVGSTSAALPVPFTFDTGGTLGGPPSVLTQGATGLDFADAGTGTCSSPRTYIAGDTCTTDVTFTPKYPGQRLGAVQLVNTSGLVIATANVYGTGTGPQIAFSPGTESVVENGIYKIWGMAVDVSGNVYILNDLNNVVVKETLSGGTYTQSTVTSTGISGPNNVAIDGSGNLYIANTGAGNVLMETPSNSGYVQSTVVSGINPVSIAVDGSGNLYITDFAGNEVLKETLSNGSYTQSTVVSGLNGPQGLAIDGSGNLYIANSTAGNVLKETLANGSYTQSTVASGLSSPQSLAVDQSGNVYIADLSNQQVLKETLSGGSYTQSVVASGNIGPLAVAVDGSGNLYYADAYHSRVLKEDYTVGPSLSFATATNVGSTDTTDGPQTVTLANSGNAVLTFTVPTSGNNPSISADFTLDSTSGGTCPLTTGTPNTLAAGARCTLPISFAPTVGGSISGSLVLTDTNLNANPSTTQTISLNGTGILLTPTLAFATIPAHIYGDTPFIVTATSLSSGAVTYTVTSGPATISGSTLTITGVGTVNLSASQAATTDYAAATATTSFAVGQATPTLAFAAIPAHIYGDAPFAVSATSASTGAVTYAVTSGPATISGSTVTLTGAGTVALSASQAATAVYAAATATTSFAVSQPAPSDFSLGMTGTSSQSIAAGGTATFSFSLAPNGGSYPGAVSFTATGLPTGATATFSPSSIAANGGAQTVTLTVKTSALAELSQPISHHGGLIAFALLFLPLAGTRRMRRVAQKLGGRASLALLLLLSLGAMAGLSGCNGSPNPFSNLPQSYTITVTASSGSAQHSSNVTLQVH